MVKIIGSWTTKQGYVMLRLSTNKIISLHALIFKNLFHKKIPKGYSINHKDYNINHNCASNLELVKANKNVRRW